MKNSTLCYIEKDGRYLMMHRVKKQDDMNRDKWLGIGGGFEEGESPYECVKRETLEETGLTLLRPSYRGLVTFCMRSGGEIFTEQMHLFTCKTFTGELSKDCDEGELEWIKKDRISKLDLWEGDRVFLKLLETEKRFFTVKLDYDGGKLLGCQVEIAGDI